MQKYNRQIRVFFVGVFLFLYNGLFAQDSTKILTFDDYMSVVKNHHPVVVQADIERKTGDAMLLMAKGGFDPKLFTEVSQKFFKGDQYYSLLDGGIKIPTWFGIELFAAYERYTGVYLNPENFNPVNGLVYSGISLPLGQGLFIDKRRADLRQAQIVQKFTIEERRRILNELYLESAKAYWDWFAAYHQYKTYENALSLAEVRFRATKQSAAIGERPAIDTVEAKILVQNRKLAQQEAKREFVNQTAFLSVFMWAEGYVPVELKDNVVPPEIEPTAELIFEDDITLDLTDSFLEAHPEFKQAQYKINQLEIERRLKREQMKPVLNMKYNFITEPVNGNPYDGFSFNNNTWGLDFSMPLMLRKERGDLKLTNLKLQDAGLELEMKQAILQYKVDASLNDLIISRDQVSLYKDAVENYQRLLNGEMKLFELGESSVFMVNTREIGFIDAQIKLVQLISKNRKAQQTLEYSLGLVD